MLTSALIAWDANVIATAPSSRLADGYSATDLHRSHAAEGMKDSN